jgi:hypothetical protein
MTTEEITGSDFNVANFDKPFWFERNYFKHWQQNKFILKQKSC